jgi:hypothetical protein
MSYETKSRLREILHYRLNLLRSIVKHEFDEKLIDKLTKVLDDFESEINFCNKCIKFKCNEDFFEEVTDEKRWVYLSKHRCCMISKCKECEEYPLINEEFIDKTPS